VVDILVKLFSRSRGTCSPACRRARRWIPAKNDENLLGERQGRELICLEFPPTLARLAAPAWALSRSLPELCEKLPVAVLPEFDLRGSGNLTHSFDLCAAADTDSRRVDVHRRTYALIEEVGFEINLPS